MQADLHREQGAGRMDGTGQVVVRGPMRFGRAVTRKDPGAVPEMCTNKKCAALSIHHVHKQGKKVNAHMPWQSDKDSPVQMGDGQETSQKKRNG
jgi:hypothetical protein